MATIRAQHYRDEQAALVADPIIQRMVRDLQQAPSIRQQFVAGGFEMMMAALNGYRNLGGKNAHSIGGVLEALQTLLAAA